MTPKYEIIRQTLLKQIETGALPPDSLLPDENALAAEYGVSLITVRRAMTELAKDGVIRRVRGKGSYVKKRAPEKKRPGEEKVIAFLLNHDNNAAVSITRIISGVQAMGFGVVAVPGRKCSLSTDTGCWWNGTCFPVPSSGRRLTA